FVSTLTRHEAVVYSKTGVKKDGTLMAREMTIYWGTGAYAEKGPTVVSAAVSQRPALIAFPTSKLTATRSTPTNPSPVPIVATAYRRAPGPANNRWMRSPNGSA